MVRSANDEAPHCAVSSSLLLALSARDPPPPDQPQSVFFL